MMLDEAAYEMDYLRIRKRAAFLSSYRNMMGADGLKIVFLYNSMETRSYM